MKPSIDLIFVFGVIIAILIVYTIHPAPFLEQLLTISISGLLGLARGAQSQAKAVAVADAKDDPPKD